VVAGTNTTYSGIVDEVGSAVSKVKKGDRVVASFQIACGDCRYCAKKLSSQCEKTNSNTIENAMYGGRTAGMFGYSHFTGGFAGGQAEYTRVPYGDVNLLKLPDDVPDEKGLFLSDVVSTSWNCVVDTGVKEGDVVAIWGAGPIGQMCADFSFINGASRVILIDQNWRLDYVKEKYPKVETVDFTQLKGAKAVVAKLKEMCDGVGPDVALECVAGEYPKTWLHTIELATGLETDTSEILNECIESVKNYGRVGITGVYVGYTNHFNIGKSSAHRVVCQEQELTCQRLPHGTRYPLHRQRSSARPSLLGGPPQEDPEWRDRPAEDGDAPCQG